MRCLRLILIFLFVSAGALLAHPHLFIESELEPLIEEGKLKGIRIYWKFDKYWSEEVIIECDTDRNGILDRQEIRLVFNDFFNDLKYSNYFTELIVNGRRQRVTGVEIFNAEIVEDNIVIYDFVIPVNADLNPGLKLSVLFDDETVYTAFDKKVGLKDNKDHPVKSMKISDNSWYGVRIDLEF
ncbi:MAG: DUF1007 family protein [Candidatus Delongbacteria bacterium]